MRRMAAAYLAAPVIPAEQGEIRLAPHQVDAASRVLALLGECGGAVLADATGLGKTFVAIAVARAIGPALIVAPASLRGMWRESLSRAGLEAEFVSYETLSRGEQHVAGRPALLVLDEAHHARNPKARRYAVIADLAWGTNVLMLSATPIHNRGRDLRALIALFIGSRAETMSEDEIRRFIVRRSSATLGASVLPALGAPEWLLVPRDPDTMRAIVELAPAVQASDGGAAHALMVLGLIRAWSSSEAALRASLRRRLRRAASFAVVLEAGRLPDRRELSSWPVVDDAIQLGFPELLRGDHSTVDVVRVRQALEKHCDGVRSIVRTLDRTCGAADNARIRHLASIRERHPSIPVVAFTQFADTAIATFHACAREGGAALVTGRGARIASGRVSVEEIVGGFDIAERDRAAAAVMPLQLLIATDVLSEGLSLRRAGVIVHLDLPWTMARLEQRVGRLRRIGSRHRSVKVFAIGPPVAARELLPVVRALQRKARLSSSMGDEELQSALPLLGARLTNATAAIIQRGESHSAEELRQVLKSWADLAVHPQLASTATKPSSFSGLALVRVAMRCRLLAVTIDGVSERPGDILAVVRTLSTRQQFVDRNPHDAVVPASRLVETWLDEQRGRDLAKPATEAPSAVHRVVLRALQDMLARSIRSERVMLSQRIENCRRLVTSARSIGAELALSRLLDSTTAFALDDLELLLQPRTPHKAPEDQTRLIALLGCGQAVDDGVSAFLSVDY